MKRILIVLAGTILSVSSFAQISWGIQATGNLSDASFNKDEDFDVTKKMRVFPGGGLVVEYKIRPGLTLRSGVNYLQHGIKLVADGILEFGGQQVNFKAEAKNSLNYIQVPVNLLYTTEGNTLQFFAGGGPYISYGISGKTQLTTTYTAPGEDPVTEKEETDIFKKEEDGGAGFKRTDFGIGILAGIKLGGNLFINAGYQFSLSNIDDIDGGKYKNRGLQLTIGKMF